MNFLIENPEIMVEITDKNMVEAGITGQDEDEVDLTGEDEFTDADDEPISLED